MCVSGGMGGRYSFEAHVIRRESCDRLSGSVSRKDNDIALLTEQLQEAQEQVMCV